MPMELEDLWPSEVDQADVMTPLMILRHQAGMLRKRTRNLLEAEVLSEPAPQDDYVRHSLDIVVPALDDYRLRLFSVYHRVRAVYPVRVDHVPNGSQNVEWLSTQDEFVRALRQRLESAWVRSAISSLLAQVNESSAVASTPSV